jgi:hypothetical protein
MGRDSQFLSKNDRKSSSFGTPVMADTIHSVARIIDL